MKRFLIGVFIVVLTYLCAAFIAADINFMCWPTDGRLLTIIVAAIFLMITMMLYDDAPPQKVFHRPKPPTKR